MKIIFDYNKERDIWCLLNYGKSSHNSNESTSVYLELIKNYGENPDTDSISNFIEKYLKEKNYDVLTYLADCQSDFGLINEEFNVIAQKIFGVALKDDITAYLTINNRCPYNIKERWFYVSMSKKYSVRPVIMHELWHFYTWYRFGIQEQDKIGGQKYNDLKESLTVLLNIECKHLLPERIEDRGYPQHQKIRAEILRLWKENPDISYVWDNSVVFMNSIDEK